MAKRAPKPKVSTIAAVAVGGMFGALARVYLPWPTLFDAAMRVVDPLPLAVMNFLGAALLGFITGIATTSQWPEPLAKGISTGFFGSFTSMSALAVIISGLTLGQAIITEVSIGYGLLGALAILAGLVAFLLLTAWVTKCAIALGTRVGGRANP